MCKSDVPQITHPDVIPNPQVYIVSIAELIISLLSASPR
jgi:hypothetical protein